MYAQCGAVLWITLAVVCLPSIHGRVIESDIYIDTKPVTRSNPGDSDTWITRVVPIELDYSTSNQQTLWKNVQVAINMIKYSIKDCLKFVNRTKWHVDYISITGRQNQGCYSSVGKRGGKQILNIDTTCMFSPGIIMHELLHALGFWHEHSRSDRDKHVQVIYTNVKPEDGVQFRIRDGNMQMERAVPYDLDSILHYKHDAFARYPGLDTIVPRSNFNKQLLGQRDHLSSKDKIRVAWLYKCGPYRVDGCARPDAKVKLEPAKRFYPVGDKVTYTCKDGYFLFGPRSSVCKVNGQWTGALPFCFNNYWRYYLNILDFDREQCVPNKTLYRDNSGRSWKVILDRNHPIRFQCNAGQTATLDSGPHTDHTYETSTGNYLYLEASRVPVGSKTLISSPLIIHKYDEQVCILFFYSMYGDGMGQLTVTYCGYGFHCVQNLTLKTKAKNDKWQMELWKPNRPYIYSTIKFEATRGYNDKSDIGIDDVVIGPCSMVEPYHDLVRNKAAYDPKEEHDDLVYDGDLTLKG